MDVYINESVDTPFVNSIMVDYLRSSFSKYDEHIGNKIGMEEAYEALNRRVYAEISRVYDELAAESNKQLAHRLNDGQT